MTTDAIIEAAARALFNNDDEYLSYWEEVSPEIHRRCRHLALSVLAAVTPLIRAAALEAAAVVADDEDGKYWYAGEHRNMVMLQQHGYEIAAAIRALIVTSPSPSADSA